MGIVRKIRIQYYAQVLSDVTGDNVLPKKVRVGVVDCLLMSCLVPKSMNLVLSGLISRWFWQHHVAAANRSSSNVLIALLVSAKGKDRNNFESST